MIDGVVVPVIHPPTQGAAQAGGQYIDARLDQATRQEQLLSPSVAAVAITNARVFPTQIERFLGLRVCQQGHRLRFELIEGGQFALLVEGTLERVKIAS